MININNSIIKGKKSQMHIEMIMSFVLFVGFIIAILLFINPVKEQKVSMLALDNAQNQILKNVSSSYSYIPLILDSSVSESCFSVDNPLPALTSNLFVQNQNNNIIKSKLDSGKIYLEKIDDSKLYKFYFSNIFNVYSSIASDCLALDESAYSFGALSVESVVLYENLLKLNESYNSDYGSLKKELKISNNFDFTIYDFNRTVLMKGDSKNKVFSSNVLAREFVLNSADKDNNKKEAILNLRVW